LRQRLEIFHRIRYHLPFSFQGKPVFFSGPPHGRRRLRKLGLAIAAAGAVGLTGAVSDVAFAERPAWLGRTIAVVELPREAQVTRLLISAGGPYPYPKDGSVFGNRERQLPAERRGYYREYTVPKPGVRDRGARRIVCGGYEPRVPEACFYTDDHYASFRRIAQ
jgi:ribonuclease T1